MIEDIKEPPVEEKKPREKTEAEKEAEIRGLDDILNNASKSGPDENIDDAPASAGPGVKPPKEEPNPIKDWFSGQGFVNEMMTEAGVYLLSIGNIKAFNVIYKNKYKPLPDDAIELDEDQRNIVDKGLQKTVPGVYAWAKKQDESVIMFLYLQWGIWRDMKSAAVPLEAEENAPPPHKMKPPAKKPAPPPPVTRKKPAPAPSQATQKKPEEKRESMVERAMRQTAPEEATFTRPIDIIEPKIEPIEVVMPVFNGKQVEVRVEKWLKKKGEPVKKGETLAEVGNNDDIDITIKAPADGILSAIYYKANQPFITGDRIAQITRPAPASEAKG